MLIICAEEARRRGLDPSFVDLGGSGSYPTCAVIAPLGEGIRGGAIWSWFLWQRRAAAVEVIGADVIDGTYSARRAIARLNLMNFCAGAGIPVALISFSLRESVPPEVRLAMRGLSRRVRIVARDDRSRLRAEECFDRPVEVAPDIVFRLEARQLRSSKLSDAIAAWRASSNVVVGVCPSLHCYRGPLRVSAEEAAEDLVEKFVGLCSTVREAIPNAKFVLTGHDSRGYPYSDYGLSESIAARLGSGGVVLERGDLPVEEFQALVREFDLLVSGRMHCGVVGLGVGTPCILLDYNDKMGGMADYFDDGVLVLVLGSDGVSDPERFRRFLLRMQEGGDGVRQRVRGTVDRLRVDAMRHFVHP